MAILDTFYILFKSDTDELKKGANEALKIADSLKSALLTAIPVGFLTAGLKHSIDFNTELAKSSRLLGVNVTDLNAWRNAVELAGGNADQFESTLKSLSERFGVSAQTALKVLPKYADALSRLNPAAAQRVGKNLGLDEGTILLLQRSRRELDALITRQKELGAVTQKDAEQYLKFNEATIKVKQATQTLFSIIAREILPHLLKFFDTLEKGIRYFAQHKDFVIGGFIALGVAVTALGIRFALASLPIYLMSALIIGLGVLFALIYDDIQNFLEGNISLLGYLIDKYPTAAAVVKEALDLMRGAIHLLLGDLDILEKKLQSLYDFFVNKFVKATGNDVLGLKKLNITGTPEQIQATLKAQVQAANLGRGGANSVQLHVNDITIHTQATDAKGIASELIPALNQEFSQVINFHGNGVFA